MQISSWVSALFACDDNFFRSRDIEMMEPCVRGWVLTRRHRDLEGDRPSHTNLSVPPTSVHHLQQQWWRDFYAKIIQNK